ncbi:MAG: urease accessory protein [Acetobacteraceae bacterium]|jgi:urease accessory protein|nr:urease accessory protein [Acetobacteraceae bacterium]
MRAMEVLPVGSWDAKQEIDRVLIDYDRRFRRRIVLATVLGAEVRIDLPQAVRLRDGDGLLVESGVVRVCAQAEELMEIHAHTDGELIRIAWHLGNRHLPVQLLNRLIRIRADHVIAEMVQGLGGHVGLIRAPFDPEAGAYSAGGHSHHHGDDDDHT